MKGEKRRIPEDMLERARSVDLLTYLQSREPDELVRISPGVYCTRSHDSLKISNGAWYWFSRGFGGVSALDYLIRVRDLDLVTAAGAVLGTRIPERETGSLRPALRTERHLELPERNATNDMVWSYLRDRGIHPAVLSSCMEQGILYESADRHSAVFVGRNEKGEPAYAALRSTTGHFKGEAPGSDKRFAFRILPEGGAETLHVFEAAIDLMSLMTLRLREGKTWQTEAWLSLGGVAPGKDSSLPASLADCLKRTQGIRTVCLHLDADGPGREAAVAIAAALQGKGLTVRDEPPPFGKDMNEYLLREIGRDRDTVLAAVRDAARDPVR